MVSPHQTTARSVDIPFVQSAPRLIAIAAFLICFATLSPFDFTPEEMTLRSAISTFFAHPSEWWDIVSNVFLFLPFGFGLAAWLKSKSVRQRFIIVIAILISALFSLSVETLQLFLPSRSSSWVDVVTNTMGGGFGSVIYAGWCATVLRRSQLLNQHIRRYVTVPTVTALLISWVLVMGLSCIALQNAARFGNWDPNFPLMVGNERTANRPWEGTVSLLEISDRALPDSEVSSVLQSSPLPQSIASYALTGAGNSRDRTRNNPDLVWQGTPSLDPTAASISAQHWLSTPTAASDLSQKLKETAEFTIHVIAAAANVTQGGPARIVSLSADPLRRNFTLGQEKDQLVFRLRTPITGENGVFTALFVPNVFRDPQPHHFLIRYQDNILSAYIDNVRNKYALSLTPELSLFRYIFPFEGRTMRLSNFSSWLYKVMFHVIFFVPLGLILALLLAIFKGQLKFYGILGMMGLLFPAFLLECLLRNDQFRVGSILLSVAIAFVTLFISEGCFTDWLASTAMETSHTFQGKTEI